MFRAGLSGEQARFLDRRQANGVRTATTLAPTVHNLSPHHWDESVFRRFLQSNELWRRKQLYQQLYTMLQQNSVSACWLMHFIRWEPNFRLVQRATRDYVIHRSCNVLDEFKGVEEIISLHRQNMLTSPGAVFSGLLSLGDRRINAVLGVLRSDLSLADVREFTRIHEPQLAAPTIEFFLSWMSELSAKKDAKKFDLICSKLHLMVLYDESGVVRDIDEASRIGFQGPVNRLSESFEDYLAKIERVFVSSQSIAVAAGSKMYEPMLDAWRSHALKARTLRVGRGTVQSIGTSEMCLA